MRKLITALVIVALLLSLSSTSVYAAGEVTGQGKGGNTAPTVDFVDFVIVDGTDQVTALSPGTEFRVRATLGDINGIADITKAEFHIYHGAIDPENWDADACAIFLWTKGATPEWTMVNGGAGTTWALGATSAGHCETVLDATTGDWYLAFKPGELAQADGGTNWHASVEVWDEKPKTGTGGGGNASMGDYIEIVMDQATIVFGDATLGIEPGQAGYIDTPASHYVTAQVTTNNTYSLSVRSEGTWDDGEEPPVKSITLSGTTGVPGTPGQFSLEIDDTMSGTDGKPFKEQAVASVDAVIETHTGDSRCTTDPGDSEGTEDTKLYMALSFALAEIDEIMYEGTITFTAAN